MREGPLSPNGQLPCPTPQRSAPRLAGLNGVVKAQRRDKLGTPDQPGCMGQDGPRTAVAPPFARGRIGGGAWRGWAGPAAGGRGPQSRVRGRRDAPGWGLGWDPACAMELLSALSLGELALSFSRVPLFPVFDLSYFIVSILYLKYEPGEPGRRAGGGWHRGAGARRGKKVLDRGG